MNYIALFDTGRDTENFGGKANRLIDMTQLGLNVPYGGVIRAVAMELYIFENPALQTALDSGDMGAIERGFSAGSFPEILAEQVFSLFKLLLSKGFSAVAVRSSGNLEDGAAQSFAGQFESYLNIRTETDLIVAIKKCWASLFGEKVLAYCKNNEISHAEFNLSVIIQGQIFSEASGVVFTANPLTGNDKQMVVEAVFGLGEALVQGSVTPDMYLYDWYEERCEMVRFGAQEQVATAAKGNSGLVWTSQISSKKALEEAEIVQLCADCLQIQEIYGEPLDIEWAVANGQFYILQARPLTAIQYKTAYNWTNADLKDGGISSSITTPMMYSLYEYIFENTMPKYFKKLHILPRKHVDKWFTWWFGYCYWNMEAAKEGAKQIPGFNERNFDKSLGIEPEYEGNGHVTRFTPRSIIDGIFILLATNKSIKERPSNCKKIIAAMQVFFEEVNTKDFDKLTLDELADFAENMIKDKYLYLEGNYFFAIYDNSNAATFCQEAIDKINATQKGDKINYLNVVSGLSDVSHLRRGNELWELAHRILSDENAKKHYEETSLDSIVTALKAVQSFPFSSELRHFLAKYKHHSLRELDITVPNWEEDPMQALVLLQSELKKGNLTNPIIATQQQHDIFVNETRKITSKSLFRKIETHRNLLWWREEMRDNSTKMYHVIRKVLLELGKKMTNIGMLAQAEDVFLITFEELFRYKSADQIPDYLRKIEKNQIFYKSFRNFDKPNEILKTIVAPRRKSENNTEGVYAGIAGSAGIVVGKANVVATIYDAANIKQGDILVTKFTDPAWTPYFSIISGLVTETGGMLSHGAVVSREYGNPAVLAVKDATKRIKTGDTIEVNGFEGTVKIVSKS